MTDKATLLLRIRRPNGTWSYAQPVLSGNNRLRPLYALIGGKAVEHLEGTYYVRYAVGGKRHWINAGKDGSTALHILEKQIHHLKGISLGFLPPVVPPATQAKAEVPTLQVRQRWSDAVRVYMLEIEARRSRRTGNAYRLALDDFAITCPDVVYLDEIDRTHVLAFEASILRKGNTARTAHNQLTSLSTFLRYWGLKDVVRKRDLPKFTEKLVDSYSTDELKKLFTASSTGDRLVFEVFLASGCREQEVMHLGKEDIDFRSGMIRVRTKPEFKWEPKDREERDIPVPDDLLIKLRVHLDNHPKQRLLFPARNGKPDGHLLRRLQRTASRAGLNCGCCLSRKKKSCGKDAACHSWTLHKFRRTFATLHHEAGVSVRTIMSWTGHSDLETIMRYLAAADKRSARTRLQVNQSFSALVT